MYKIKESVESVVTITRCQGQDLTRMVAFTEMGCWSRGKIIIINNIKSILLKTTSHQSFFKIKIK